MNADDFNDQSAPNTSTKLGCHTIWPSTDWASAVWTRRIAPEAADRTIGRMRDQNHMIGQYLIVRYGWG